MDTLLEEDASLTRPGGTLYVRVSPTFMKYLGIEINANNEIISDLKIAIGLGKHGKYAYLYSPKDQRKYQREKAKEAENQRTL